MACPAGGILASAILAGSGPIQHGFNPLPDSGSGFCFRVPDRFYTLQHEGRVNFLYRQQHQLLCIGVQCAGPLGGMLRVLPTGLVCLDIAHCTVSECPLASCALEWPQIASAGPLRWGLDCPLLACDI